VYEDIALGECRDRFGFNRKCVKMSELFGTYGRALFNRSYRGLYGGKMIRFGNKVADNGRKSRRTWKPNVQTKTYVSEYLQEKVKIKVATCVMRQIKYKCDGSFDTYLIKTPESIIKMPLIIDMKRRIHEILRQRSIDGIKKSQERQKAQQQIEQPSNSENSIASSSPSTTV